MNAKSLSKFALSLTFTVSLCAATHAANNVPSPKSLPPVQHMPPLQVQVASCPAPYVMSTQGFDTKKGEYQCIKTDATCPDGFNSATNEQTGQLTCTPKQTPQGWSQGAGGGKLVYDSAPQPNVYCPSSTPDWKWGTKYFKESWNRMGCIANLKPAS